MSLALGTERSGLTEVSLPLGSKERGKEGVFLHLDREKGVCSISISGYLGKGSEISLLRERYKVSLPLGTQGGVCLSLPLNTEGRGCCFSSSRYGEGQSEVSLPLGSKERGMERVSLPIDCEERGL